MRQSQNKPCSVNYYLKEKSHEIFEPIFIKTNFTWALNRHKRFYKFFFRADIHDIYVVNNYVDSLSGYSTKTMRTQCQWCSQQLGRHGVSI